MRKLKIFLLAATVIGFVSLTGGCKKTYTTVVQNADSVSSSGWLTIADTLYVNSGNGDSIYQETFTNPAITSAVVSGGVVLSYIGQVVSTGDTASEQALEYDVYTTYEVGAVTIDSPTGDEGGYGDISTSQYGWYYRYVIVPGYVLTTNNITKQQAKSMSYTEITKLLSTAKTSSPASITQ